MKILTSLTLLSLAALLSACGPAEDTAPENTATVASSMQKKTAMATQEMESAELAKVPSGVYTIDKSHAYVSFTYLHKGLSNPVVGFRDFDVTLELDADAPQNSSLMVKIDPDSIDSRVTEFDEHLKGDKMFDTAKFPDITFKSTSINMTAANDMEVIGDLTMKGVTKPVTLTTRINKTAIDSRSNLAKIGVSAGTTIKRSEWDLGYAVPVVGNEVTISIELEMSQVPPAG